ncbi:MAG: DUF3566 domain-containing protein [Elusimicrobiota bacterium]|jgi:hypothetical protein
MSYHIRRIDPFWKPGPVVIGLGVIGALAAAFGYARGILPVAAGGAVLMSVGVIMAAKPVLTGVLGCLGFFGGLVTFVLMPNVNTVGMSFGYKLLSTLLFTVLYMVLMDALILVVAALYNAFSSVCGGIELDIDATGPTGS